MTDGPFGPPVGLLQRLTRGEVRIGDLVVAAEGLRGDLVAPGLALGVADGPVLVVEEAGRRTCVPIADLAAEMSRARVLGTPEGLRAALRSWLLHRPVPDTAAAQGGIAVLDWTDPGQTVLGWRVVVVREGIVVPWHPSGTASLPTIHQVRSAALGRSHRIAADLRLQGPVALWCHRGVPGLDTALLVRPEELIEEAAAAGLPLRDAHVVITPRGPVACAEAGVARRLASEATGSSITLPWRDLADLGWA